MSYIQIKDLQYYYPREDKKALENLNFNIEKGEFILITGSSGSGKSTLARCLSGSIPYFYGGTQGGTITINGSALKDLDLKTRAKEISMVFQDPERQLMMNKVHRELAFGLENINTEASLIKRRVWETLQFTNLLDLAYREVTTLSGGEKQKVAIASALSYMPKCIILDEPCSQLDPSSCDEIISLLKKINEELGITIIVIEQRVDKWFQLVDRIMLLNKGKSIFFGTKEDFYSLSDTELYSFLPIPLKLSKLLGLKAIPSGTKELREILKNFSFNSPIEGGPNTKGVAIKIDNLTCKYEDKIAISDLSLNIRAQDFLGVIGSNGAGKSTLMKAIMGLIKYKGSVKVFDKEASKTEIKELSSFVGYVSQNPNDYLSKDSVYEEIKFTLDNYCIKDAARIEDTLKDLGIFELKDRNPRDLSGGERQRVAIATILVLKPKILILDEPTRGLDYDIKEKLGETLSRLNLTGTTIILITHDINFAAEYCKNFLLMFKGEGVAFGSSSQVLGNGLFYTTTINKLLRGREENIFTLKQAKELLKRGKVE